jgi:hypothetical protein
MMSSLVGLKEHLSRSRQLGESFVRSELSPSLMSEPHSDIAIAVFHFFTLPAYVPAVPVTYRVGRNAAAIGCCYSVLAHKP